MAEVLVLCGDAIGGGDAEDELRLALSGPGQNVTLKVQDLSSRLLRRIPDRLLDLVEIATYVYCADQAISRGGEAQRGMGADWRRSFRFVIPVREPDHWSQAKIVGMLRSTLSFLSDDDYEFEFEVAAEPPPRESYFDFGPNAAGFNAQVVVPFSGGLDSLAGAVHLLTTGDDRVALMSHRPATKIYEHQKHLAGKLMQRFPGRVLHVPVLATRQERLPAAETTQRSRSFLYAALACATARTLGANRISFYENGVLSIHLPISEQLVGARVTRTTHPLVLQGFEDLLTSTAGAKVGVSNPFIWNTKAEIVRTIVDGGCGDLIDRAVSCSKVRAMTKEHTHCGCCSQCIDRRFGVLAADAAAHDSADKYKVDLLTGPREKPKDITMAESYARSAVELARMNDMAFFERYGGEASRVLGCFGGMTADEVGRKVFDMHIRHAAGVAAVLHAGVANHREALVARCLPASSLLMMAIAPQSPCSTPATLASEMVETWAEEIEAERKAEAPTPGFRLEVAFSADTDGVAIRDLPPLGAADCALLRRLYEKFAEDQKRGRLSKHYEYYPPLELAGALGVEDTTLRRRIARCRAAVAKGLEDLTGEIVPKDILIQNQHARGYRLNPDVRIVAMSELEAQTPASHSAKQSVTNRRRPR